MNGLMMDFPLDLTTVLKRGAKLFPKKTITSRMADESLHAYDYGQFYARVLRLMNALRALGVKPGDRVATFAWNTYRHLELYFGIPCLGAVLHTLNIRLFPEQLKYIVNHAEDQFIFVDASLAKALLPLLADFKTVKKIIVMDDKAALPPGLENVLFYEDLIQSAKEFEDFPRLDENTAAGLCYTSGTTGDPKGVLYSHRSFTLHSMAICFADTFGIRESDCVLPVVPMFHANAWGLPYAAVLTGASMAFPGAHLTGPGIAGLMEKARVTLAAGVPTIWKILYHHLKQHKYDLSAMRCMVIGGSAVPRSMIEDFDRDFGIPVLQGWGMTEMSPVGTTSALKSEMHDWPTEKKSTYRAKQGIAIPFVEMKAVDDDGNEVARDGKTIGELLVRGPWVARSYYQSPDNAAFTADGWFRTGDVVTIDEHGFMEITDRKKDLIKSRGEWISSVDMENYAMACPGVLEACVIGKADAVRDEVPAVFVALTPEEKSKSDQERLSAKKVHDWLAQKFAHWQLPKLQDIHFIESVPKTSVGKFDKKALRKMV